MKRYKVNEIIIFNYWWTKGNYGALLTAYALQNLLRELNYKPLLANNYKKKNYTDFKYSTDNFILKNIRTTNKICRIEDLTNLNLLSKIFIAGSDQVFRPIYTNNALGEHLLDFVNSGIKKIAFSASFGVDKEKFLQENSAEILEHMKKSLKSFDFLSIREKSGVEICKELFNVDAEWIIDPVFIMDKSDYYELIKNSTKDFSNKIVSYILDTSKECKKIYKYLAKKYNSEVIELANLNESVENWLASIKNCKFLITDSFHGMCFAIIFNKPFICITNQNRGATRFESILEMLNIENNCINSINEIYEKNCIFKIDYEKVNKRIEEERQRGLDFLKIALDAPISKQAEKIKAKLEFLEEKVCELEEQATLKYQLKRELWNLWLVIFHKYLPKPIKAIIRNLKQKGTK